MFITWKNNKKEFVKVYDEIDWQVQLLYESEDLFTGLSGAVERIILLIFCAVVLRFRENMK